MSGGGGFPVGVVGVGSMGENHARVYAELPAVDLVGVADADEERAAAVADEYDTEARSTADLLSTVDAVSVAVPTSLHAGVVRTCLDHGTAALVEKPFVADPEVGRELAAAADEAGVTLQVGHIERFNPAVTTLFDLLGDVTPVAISAERLGPPLGRDVGDDVVMDLMIHDIDVLLALLGERPGSISATGRGDGQYATAQFTFPGGTVGRLTASRLTQRKIRRLRVTTEDRLVQVDYLDQSVRIHRRSRPAFEQSDGSLRYQTERLTERPIVDSGEPLRRELSAFVEAAQTGRPPEVTATDGVRAVETAAAVQEAAIRAPPFADEAHEGDPNDAGDADRASDADTIDLRDRRGEGS
jgi:predicted dehydrogenase